MVKHEKRVNIKAHRNQSVRSVGGGRVCVFVFQHGWTQPVPAEQRGRNTDGEEICVQGDGGVYLGQTQTDQRSAQDRIQQ